MTPRHGQKAVQASHELTFCNRRGNEVEVALKADSASSRRRLQFKAPIRVQSVEVVTIREPNPLIPSFSPSGGEGARRAVEGDFLGLMAPTYVGIWDVPGFHKQGGADLSAGLCVRQPIPTVDKGCAGVQMKKGALQGRRIGVPR
jgi:hypothetical protein